MVNAPVGVRMSPNEILASEKPESGTSSFELLPVWLACALAASARRAVRLHGFKRLMT